MAAAKYLGHGLWGQMSSSVSETPPEKKRHYTHLHSPCMSHTQHRFFFPRARPCSGESIWLHWFRDSFSCICHIQLGPTFHPFHHFRLFVLLCTFLQEAYFPFSTSLPLCVLDSLPARESEPTLDHPEQRMKAIQDSWLALFDPFSKNRDLHLLRALHPKGCMKLKKVCDWTWFFKTTGRIQRESFSKMTPYAFAPNTHQHWCPGKMCQKNS